MFDVKYNIGNMKLSKSRQIHLHSTNTQDFINLIFGWNQMLPTDFVSIYKWATSLVQTDTKWIVQSSLTERLPTPAVQ